MIKVAKFGGSSVADAAQFRKVKEIICADNSRRLIVVSAAGKRFKDDNKITDLLYLCEAHIRYGVNVDSVFQIIVDRFEEIKSDLGILIDLSAEMNVIRKRLVKGVDVDYLVSRGEYITARLLAEYIGYAFVDASEILFFDFHGNVDYERSTRAFKAMYEKCPYMVIPGFYGSYPDGNIHVMARGGSDITGSYIASMAKAALYENWTDVSGILIADPRIVKKPKSISKITYRELRELSYMGASVLHEEAIFPVMEADIPINIKNTNDPLHPGTTIIEFDDIEEEKDHFVTGIAGKKDFSVITVTKSHMSNEIGMVRRALEVFEKYRISIEHIPSGIDSFSVVVATSDVKKYIHDIVVDIKHACQTDQIKVIDEISLIATVGRNMVYRPGISGKLFATLGNHDINIRMIAQGSEEINIIIGVENKDFEKTIKVIYDNFV